MNRNEGVPNLENVNPKQELLDIYDRGITKIRDYIAGFKDVEVQNTATHFAQYFDEVKRVADEVGGELTNAQKQELLDIYDRGITKITAYTSGTADREVKNTAAHFFHLFEDIKMAIESK